MPEWIEEVRGSYQGDEYAKKVQEKFDDGSKEKEGWTVGSSTDWVENK